MNYCSAMKSQHDIKWDINVSSCGNSLFLSPSQASLAHTLRQSKASPSLSLECGNNIVFRNISTELAHSRSESSRVSLQVCLWSNSGGWAARWTTLVMVQSFTMTHWSYSIVGSCITLCIATLCRLSHLNDSKSMWSSSCTTKHLPLNVWSTDAPTDVKGILTTDDVLQWPLKKTRHEIINILICCHSECYFNQQ